MNTLGTAILGRRIGGGDKVVDTVQKAPRGHGIGDQLPIICHKDFKGPVKLRRDVFVPVL
jgi:hypothetical protein